MGSDAVIYLFDYERYRDEVVPAFQRLLLEGDFEPCSQILPDPDALSIDERLLRYFRQHPTDLVRFCHYLANDFAFPGPRPPLPWSAQIGWEARTCQSRTCPARQHCLFHVLQPEDDLVCEFNVLFEQAVCARCLGEWQFVGRSVNAHWYDEALQRMQVPGGHPLARLLHHLGSRGWVVGYECSGSGEGIHGWLTPAETEQLAAQLAALPLPNYTPTFAAMEQFRKIHPGPYECAGGPFDDLSLSFVRTVATIAVTRQLGLLWGNDLLLLPPS
jgi:hypothetical protein